MRRPVAGHCIAAAGCATGVNEDLTLMARQVILDE
jgi:hypothetical protein